MRGPEKMAFAREERGDQLAGAKDPRGRCVSVDPGPQPTPGSRSVLTLSLSVPSLKPSLSLVPLFRLTYSLTSFSLPGHLHHGPKDPRLEKGQTRPQPLPVIGSHSLRYLHILVSRPGHGSDLYSSVGFLDDTQFVRFSSDAANPRVEPRAQWMEQEGREYWDRQTDIAKEHSKASRSNLRVIIGNHNHSQSGKFLHPLTRAGVSLRFWVQDSPRGQALSSGKSPLGFTWILFSI